MYVFYWKINAFLRKTGKVLLIIMDIELILFGLKLRNFIIRTQILFYQSLSIY